MEKLQAQISEAAWAEIELKKALRDALQQLKIAIEQRNAAESRNTQNSVAFQEALHAVEAGSHSRDLEVATLRTRCHELESRDEERLAQLSQQAAELDRVREQLAHSRLEIQTLKAEVAVSFSQQQYFETAIKDYAK